MSSYDYQRVWITEDAVQEMLMHVGGAIETLSRRLTMLGMGEYPQRIELSQVIDGLKRAREIGGQILSDVSGDNDE